MAGLSFMESFALGYMAAGSGPGLAETGVAALHDLRYKRDLAQADANYTALVNEYNRLVNGINELYRHGVGLEATVARQNERIAHLEQTIAVAIEGATELEQRVAAAEQRAADLAAREAEARRDAAFYKMRHRSMGEIATEHARDLNKARAEIGRLEAIIAGMSKPPEQRSPSPDTSTS